MSHLAELTTIRTVSEPPAIAGLRFRKFAGEEDYPSMLAVIERSKEADQIERTDTLDDIRRNYAHLVNSDPQTDMLFAEVNGHVVGYSRVWWQFVDDGQRVYSHLSFLLPEWRGYGIRLAMLRFSERRLAEIARGHNSSLPAFYEAWASDGEHHLRQLLEAQGYCAVRYGFEQAAREVQDLYLSGDKFAAMSAIPGELIDEVALVGPRERVRERLQLWRESPVRTLNMMISDVATLRTMVELVAEGAA